MTAPALTPAQTVRALAVLFPAAKFGSEIIVTVVRGVVTSIKAPRPVTTDELAAALASAPASPAPVRLDTDLVLSRFTDAERAALFTARRSVWQVDYFITRAATTGIVSTADPDLPAAQAMFAALGIIAADRWPALLAAP